MLRRLLVAGGKEETMAKEGTPSWLQTPNELITLVNRSQHNYILDLPTGRCRLDRGRRIRTVRSVAATPEVKALLDRGELAIERS